MSKGNLVGLNDEGRKRQINRWCEDIIGHMRDVTDKYEGEAFFTKDDLCNAVGMSTHYWSDVKQRLVERGLPIAYKPFEGYFYGPNQQETLFLHVLLVLRGLTKSNRDIVKAMFDEGSGHTPDDIRSYLEGVGTDGPQFIKLLEVFDEVEQLPSGLVKLLKA